MCELKESNNYVISQLCYFLNQFDDNNYSKKLGVLSGSSVGMYVRHILEFYSCFLKIINSEDICYDSRKIKLIYPVDSDKIGTWFCCDKSNKVACILNEAFEKHKSNPQYKKSRGVIVLESFLNNSFENWIENVNLKNIEPFTLILFEKDRLTELRWDEKQKHVKNLSTTQPRIWSSVTLYSKEAISLRNNWLYKWLEPSPVSPENLFDFHNYGGKNSKETKLRMEIIGSHQTVSITQLHISKLERKINHVNFVSKQKSNLSF